MGIVWLVILLAANAFFVAAEFAVVAARRSQIEPQAKAGSRAAKTTLWAMEHVSLMLAVCQLGITVCSLLILNVSEPAIHHLFQGPLALLGIPEAAVDVIAFALALVIVTYLHVVVGEMIPKNISLAVSDRAALLLAPPLVMIGRVFRFVIVPLNAAANGLLKLFRVDTKDEVNSTFTVEEVQSIVSESMKEGKLTDEMGLLSGALEFSEYSAGDVMVTKDKLVTIAVGCTPEEVERLVGQTGFSRFLLEDDDGDLVGYLHLKDVLYADDEAYTHREPVPEKRFRALVNVALTDEVEDALATMQRSGSHVARVLDAEGTTHGVVFLEDVLEELVGEVHDAMQRERARLT
ncbi:hemolysin family protein [Saxibacter everestensis]|uniref:Hemolysin family protein n=2 Tax=Saxibacter everestensis TaxID=2909229 RepID=A0ABY8QYT5_9MICO|nr:hemolysin family protein [Brevibacteriaceae bacterium ZFBP1038]